MYFEELAESIKKDLLRDKSYDRYPVRFFGMNLSSNSANELLDLKNTLNKVSEYPVEMYTVIHPYYSNFKPPFPAARF